MLPLELELTDAHQDPNTFVETGLSISAISRINHSSTSKEQNLKSEAEAIAYKLVDLKSSPAGNIAVL